MEKLLACVAIGIVVLTAAPIHAQNPDPAAQTHHTYEACTKLYTDLDFKQAEGCFAAFVAQNPTNPQANDAVRLHLECVLKSQNATNAEKVAQKYLDDPVLSQNQDIVKTCQDAIVHIHWSRCEAFYSQSDFKNAASCFEDLATKHPATAMTDKALNNAAVAFSKSNQPNKALAAYRTLYTQHPDSMHAEEALRYSIVILKKEGQPDKAIKLMQTAIQRYPKSDYSVDLSLELMAMHAQAKRFELAAQHAEGFTRRYPRHEHTATAALWQGLWWEKAGKPVKAIKSHQRFIKTHRRADTNMLATAWVALARLHRLQTGSAQQAQQAAQRALKLVGARPDDIQPDVAAEAFFIMGQLEHDKTRAVKLNITNPDDLTKALKKRMKLLKDTEALYIKVISHGSVQWSVAALYSAGMLYTEMADEMRDTPVPPGMDANTYRQAIENFAVNIENKGHEFIAVAAEKAEETQLQTEYAKRARQAHDAITKGP